MARRVVTPEQFLDLQFPLQGYSDATEFLKQPPLTARFAENVRGTEPVGGLDRGGVRMGLRRWIDDLVAGSGDVVQHLDVIVDPQAPRLWAYAPEETDRPLGPGPDDAVLDASTNNDADGRGNRRNPGAKYRRGGNGVSKKRPRSGCTLTLREFEFDPIFSELLLFCEVANCSEGGAGDDPLNVVIELESDEHHFDWTGGGLPTAAFINTSLETVTGNALTYCTGFTDTPL